VTVAHLIFAPYAVDRASFEDYALKMHGQYSKVGASAWLLGPALGDSPLMDRPAEMLRVSLKRVKLRGMCRRDLTG
jgi:hypothetical protein